MKSTHSLILNYVHSAKSKAIETVKYPGFQVLLPGERNEYVEHKRFYACENISVWFYSGEYMYYTFVQTHKICNH